jgi:hypothetical protein
MLIVGAWQRERRLANSGLLFESTIYRKIETRDRKPATTAKKQVGSCWSGGAGKNLLSLIETRPTTPAGGAVKYD